MDKLEEKKDNLEYAIDEIDTAIYHLKKYKRYKDMCEQLTDYKSCLEFDLDELNERYEELVEEKIKEAQEERKEREIEYWKGAI